MASANISYKSALQRTEFRFVLTNGVLAIPECNNNGNIQYYLGLPKNFIIVQNLGQGKYVCSCDNDDEDDCIHLTEGIEFLRRDDVVDLSQEDVSNVYPGLYQPANKSSLHGVYCSQDKSFSIIRRKSYDTCLVCKKDKTSCCHTIASMALYNNPLGNQAQVFTAI